MVSEGSGAGGGEDCRGSGFALRNCCTGPVCSQNLKLVRDADGNISAENQMDCSYGYCLALQEILQGFLQNTWKKEQSMHFGFLGKGKFCKILLKKRWIDSDPVYHIKFRRFRVCSPLIMQES